MAKSNLKREGSLYGGTRLHIRGYGFNVEDHSANVVTVDGEPCKVVKFYTTANYLQCLTSAAKNPEPASLDDLKNRSVTVTVDGIQAECSSICEFTYRNDRSALLETMVPTQAILGGDIAFRGIVRNTDYKLFNEARIGDKSAQILVKNDLASFNTWNTFNVSATLGENQHGDTNSELRIDGNYGLAGWKWTADTYTLDGQTAYKFMAIGNIESISHSTGSSEGGQLITIRGQGFMTNKSKVSIDINGAPCAVQELWMDEITCLTSKKAASPTFTGQFPSGAGVRNYIWLGAARNAESTIAALDEATALFVHRMTMQTNYNYDGDDQKYKQKLVGLFKAPYTGEYTFYVSSDDAPKFGSTPTQLLMPRVTLQ